MSIGMAGGASSIGHYQLLYAESPTVMDNRMQAIQYGYGADFYNEIKLHIQPLTAGCGWQHPR
ncbi:hypothetical protein MASR2M15_29070 [Anaerolineales bacterium]